MSCLLFPSQFQLYFRKYLLCMQTLLRQNISIFRRRHRTTLLQALLSIVTSPDISHFSIFHSRKFSVRHQSTGNLARKSTLYVRYHVPHCSMIVTEVGTEAQNIPNWVKCGVCGPQAWHDFSTQVIFSVEKYTIDSLLHVIFPTDQIFKCGHICSFMSHSGNTMYKSRWSLAGNSTS